MCSVLKHTQCAACGHRHNFCFLGDDLTPGQEYYFLCPETAKPARLRPTVKPEIFHSPPQGAVLLELSVPSSSPHNGGQPPDSAPKRLQDVLPEVKDLAAKVGGLEQLSNLVETLKETKE